jgi:hypothetical protein
MALLIYTLRKFITSVLLQASNFHGSIILSTTSRKNPLKYNGNNDFFFFFNILCYDIIFYVHKHFILKFTLSLCYGEDYKQFQ